MISYYLEFDNREDRDNGKQTRTGHIGSVIALLGSGEGAVHSSEGCSGYKRDPEVGHYQKGVSSAYIHDCCLKIDRSTASKVHPKLVSFVDSMKGELK